MKIPFLGARVRLTSPYGPRTDVPGTSGFHGGVDLVGLDSWSVVSVVSGTVAASDYITDHSNANWMWGQHIIIAGDDGKIYMYFHLSERKVQRFERVDAGQVIGTMGNTGYSFGAHLHFEVRGYKESITYGVSFTTDENIFILRCAKVMPRPELMRRIISAYRTKKESTK